MAIIWAVILLAGISFLSAYIFSNIILFSHRQPIVKTPKDYGMGYEDISFKSRDGLTMKGWFIPAEKTTNRVVIMTHPLPFNRHGFLARNQGFPPLCNVDVDLLKTAKAAHQAGYGVLMFDFRNHGESDAGITGVGLSEWQDVLGAVDYINARPDLSGPQIGFFSFCMGADSTIIALSKAKDELKNIKFLVAVQPVSADVFVRSYMKAVYTPLSLYLVPMVDWLVQRRGGWALAAMSPREYAKDLRVPTFYIQARGDRWTELSDTQSFYDATAEPKEIWWIDEVSQRFEAYNYVGEHPERMLAFAGKYFN